MASPVKIWHTSDWHLGKKFFNHELKEDQGLFLQWFTHEIKQQKPDILLICGDIFDTARPPHWAMKLLWDFFAEIIEHTDTTVLCIAGNHDSGSFVEAPEKLISSKQIKVRGEIKPDIKGHKFLFSKNDIHLDFTLFPYFRENQLTSFFATKEISGLENFCHQAHAYFENKSIGKYKKILLGHHLFGDYMPEGSELPLLSSGFSFLPKEKLAKYFDLICLGHIHRPQTISTANPIALYSGAPMPFRFKEQMKKSYFEILIDEKIEIEKKQIPLARKFFSFQWNGENALENFNKLEFDDEKLKPFVEIQLSLKEANPKLCDHILLNWPYEKALLLNFKTDYETVKSQNLENFEELTTMDLFQHYIEKKEFSKTTKQELKEDFFKILETAELSFEQLQQDCQESHHEV